MAEKGFGVKEVNLIGASGTPTITSPNNLNLNANNVAISTNVSVGGTLTVSGNISIGGTLTYEDVTNIDSVGLITARAGINLTGGNITLGDSSGSSDDRIKFGASNDCHIHHNGTDTFISNDTGDLVLNNIGDNSDDIFIRSKDDITLQVQSSEDAIVCKGDGAVELYHNANKKFETSSSGATVTGTLTATTFSGSGASLTSIPAGQLTGTVADARISTLTASKLSGALPAISGANLTNLPATDPTNSDIQVVYTVTANGSSAYRFAGNGVVSTADNPDLYLIRGQKYRFVNNSGGSHPFQIRESSGGTAYSTGVTNNGAASGNIDFAPTFDSPAQLVYQCTSHGGMVGNIYLRDAAGNNTNVGVTTFAGGNSHIALTNSSNTPKIEFKANSVADAGRIQLSESSGGGVMMFYTKTTGGTDTERVRIDTNGDLGLGIAAVPQDSGARTLHVHSTTTGGGARAAIRLTHGSSGSSASNGAFLGLDNNPDFYIYNQESGKLRFGTAGSERMRINSSGQVGVNRDTDPLNGVKLMVQNGSNNVFYAYHEGTGNNYTFLCRNDRAVSSTQATQIIFLGSGNTYVGDIKSNGSSTSYNTSSDYRLKENVTTISDGITRLKTLKPSRFNFITNPSQTVDGFLAHEVTAVPEAISGTKDEVVTQAMIDNGDAPSDSKLNDPIYQQIDQAKLVPLLTAALQEAVAKIETLESKVATLEGS